MTEKFKLNDVVRIKKKKHGLDLFYQYGQSHYRKFHIGEIGRIIIIEKDVSPVTRDLSNRYLPVRFDIIKIWVHHKGGNPYIYRCMEDELTIANKDECKKYEEIDEKYEARRIAERL